LNGERVTGSNCDLNGELPWVMKNKNCEELRKFLEFNNKFASPNMEIVEKVVTEGYDSVE
jgi:hypothetical protein